MTARWPDALAGVAAGAVTLGVAELGAAVFMRGGIGSDNGSPLVAVAGAFIDLTPAWLKDFAVGVFGTSDKLALYVGMGVVITAACALVGLVRRARVGLGLFAVGGLIGMLAVWSRPNSAWPDLVPTVAGTVLGLWVLAWLWQRSAVDSPADAQAIVASRRAVLLWGTGLLAAGLVGTLVGRALSQVGQAVEAARDYLAGMRVREPVTVPAAASQDVTGQTSYITPNDEFYRVDTAVLVPRVNPDEWQLRVTGLVDRELTLTFDDLLAEELVEALVTLTCVSNFVGGELAGNAVWTGLPVREVLARAGVRPGADMVLSTSVDGFTAGTPLTALTDERNALLAVAMNGEPLPTQHGFPVRLVVPGLYGYVSATKWVTELKVTTFADDQGYWTPRGWSALGPVKTASRIDVPRGGSVPGGAVVVAGVAWAQHRGVSRVEVRIGDSGWQEATLAAEPSIDSWRQWMYRWDATPGDYEITVRATDGDGQLQTEEQASPAPDGATGWHTVQVRVD
ncbi:MAG: molybdopterin-dependent oxidoreductase [Brooklawnia sp.]|jgi:DMSO/TMAO reductase YedYZ molybdopterin-dependent catalytic subunit